MEPINEEKRQKLIPWMDSLPLEVMLEIFTLLTPKERRNASLVSRSWLDALQYATFRKDYTLTLIDCHIDESHPFVAMARNTMRKFATLKIGGKITWVTETTVREVLEKIGPGVQELIISNVNMEFLNQIHPLQYFTGLKVLKIKDLHLIKEFPAFPMTLEEIHVEYLQTVEPKDIIKRIKTTTKVNCLKATVCRLEGGLGDLIKIAKIFKDVAHTLVTLDPPLEGLLTELSNDPTRNVSINSSNNFLEPLPVTIENITCLKLREGIKTFEPIKRFPNLIGLDVILAVNNELGCFFGHEVILKPKLTMFRIVNTCKKTCMHCFRTMVDSFPNLQTLVLQNVEFKDEHIKIINYNLTKLVKLDIIGNKLTDQIVFGDRNEYLLGNLKRLKSLSVPQTYLISDFSLARWQLMPNLTELSIGQVAPTLISSMRNFVRQVPNMRVFKIGPDADLNDRKLELMVTGWPNLRKLSIDGLSSISSAGLNHIKLHCQRLEVLDFWDDRIGIDEEYDFFSKMPSLNRISNADRVMYREDYLQIEKYVKIHQIPYASLGSLQKMIQEYAICDSDNE